MNYTNQVTISKALARECAEALLAKHNSIPRDMEHDNVILLSFRSLYPRLVALEAQDLIAVAIRPVNPKGLPLFI